VWVLRARNSHFAPRTHSVQKGLVCGECEIAAAADSTRFAKMAAAARVWKKSAESRRGGVMMQEVSPFAGVCSSRSH